VLAASLLLLALLAGIAGTTVGMVRAIDAERKAVDAERTAREETEAKDKALAAEAEQRQEADRRRKDAETQRDRALIARTRTREVLDLMTSEATEDALARQASLAPEQRAFYEKALPLYEEFAAEPGEDLAALRRVAAAHARMAHLLMRLGSGARATATGGKAVELYEQLAADPAATPADRAGLARALSFYGSRQADAGSADWIRLLSRAEELFGRVADEIPSDPDLREGQAKAARELGWNLCNNNTPGRDAREGLNVLRRSIGVYERIVAEYPDRARYKLGLAEALRHLATEGLRVRGRETEGYRAIERAVALCRQLIDQAPADPARRIRLFWVYQSKSRFLICCLPTGPLRPPLIPSGLHRWRGPSDGVPGVEMQAEIEAALRGMAEEAERVVALTPADRQATYILGNAHYQRGMYLYRFRGDDAGALAAFSRAVDSWLRPAGGAAHPEPAAESLGYRATVLERLGRHREAAADWASRIEILPDQPLKDWSRMRQAQALARAGDLATAVEMAEALYRAETGSNTTPKLPPGVGRDTPWAAEWSVFLTHGAPLGASVMAVAAGQATDPGTAGTPPGRSRCSASRSRVAFASGSPQSAGRTSTRSAGGTTSGTS
jgi:tetratricopeptide (TPR) repeat protein